MNNKEHVCQVILGSWGMLWRYVTEICNTCTWKWYAIYRVVNIAVLVL